MIPESSHRSPDLRNPPALLVIAVISALSLAHLNAAPSLTLSPASDRSDTSSSKTELTNTVVANITVGGGVADGVVTPDNSTLYVGNSSANTGNVAVIDTATNTVTTTIAVGFFPSSLAITGDGSTLYVACEKSISVIATSTNTVSTTISIGAWDLALSPDGKSLYVLDHEGVQIVDIATNEVVKDIPYSDPEGALQVLFEPNGAYAWVISRTKYTRNGEQGGILRINTKTLATEKCIWGNLVDPGPATITPNGSKIYVGSLGKIAIFNTATKRMAGSIPITGYEGGLDGIPAVTPDGGYLYFPMGKNILVIDAATNANAGITIPVFESPFVTIAPNGSFAYVGAVFGTPNGYGAVLTVAISEPTNARADSRQAQPK
jgi:YVTN family beta-propeller protein